MRESGPARLFSRAFAVAAGVVLVALLASPLAFHAFFTGLEDYDDEGYLLISLREYARGGVLYDEVYSQYGPAYFQLLTPVFRLGRLAFVPTHGRALGALVLLVTAIVCAVAIWRLSRSVLLALAGELLVVHALVPSRAEPLHPGALLALLLAGLVLAGTFLETGRGRAAAVVGGDAPGDDAPREGERRRVRRRRRRRGAGRREPGRAGRRRPAHGGGGGDDRAPGPPDGAPAGGAHHPGLPRRRPRVRARGGAGRVRRFGRTAAGRWTGLDPGPRRPRSC